MNEDLPIIAGKEGKAVNLYPGVYSYCTCGKSSDQPFCNGAHAGTDFVPKTFKISEPSATYLCMCKHSKNAPYCDGSHKNV